MSTEAPPALQPGACPDPESLAAYIDGRMPPHAREPIEQHLSGCPDCRDVVGDGSVAPDSGSQPRPPRERLIAIAVAALATAAAVLLAVRWLVPPAGAGTIGDLRDALGGTRPVEARLSGGFGYLPLQPTMRSGERQAVSPQLLLAVAMLEKRARETRSAANLRAFGSAQLLTGNFDASIATFDEAVRLAPGDRDARMDLAAAHIARGRQRNDAADYQSALAILDGIDGPPAAEALFNRALALEGLGRHDEAVAAWQRYLARDGATGWADEARHRLASRRR